MGFIRNLKLNRMKDFKLIAIRPLEGCDKKYLKVLKSNVVYKFYNDYNFSFENNDPQNPVVSIAHEPSIPKDLFYITTKYKLLPINISAIVGKNGSGKSSLVEIIYISIFQIAQHLKILPENNFEGEKIEAVKRLRVEIFYLRNDEFIKITIDNEKILIDRAFGEENAKQPVKSAFTKNDLKGMFYSLVINYSHYSLNSIHLGDWIKNIFHKNDAYQTPIVINPFRDEGNIDINNEEYLTRSRLIVNLLRISSDKQHRILAPNKIAEQIKFKLNTNKSKFDKKNKLIEKCLHNNKADILSNTFKLLSKRKTLEYFNVDDKTLNTAFNYIIKKLYNISTKYTIYQDLGLSFISLNESNYEFHLKKFNSFLRELKKDRSHITFKLRQALNFVENATFYENKVDKWINLDELSIDLQSKKGRLKQLIDIIPPSFFDVEIKFKGGSLFSSLSSGEKQRIFATSTLTYHLINLSSVSTRRLIKYKCINVVFDEIELYYHPELQRTFIYDILSQLENIDIRDIESINFLFVTHSPFILSDIPNTNILFLNENGMPNYSLNKERTFGANIYDLLANDFFMKKDGAVGEWAKTKIDNVVNLLLGEATLPEKKQVEIQDLISIIGEPLIRHRLQEIYDEKYKSNNLIKAEIKRLQDLLEKN